MKNRMQAQLRDPKSLFFNSISSDYTRNLYNIYIAKFLQVYGYNDLDHLTREGEANPKVIESQIIDLIIGLKERGMKRAAIFNYTKPVITFCKINDIVLNSSKINRFMPKDVKSAKTNAYTDEQIHQLLEIADERMTATILLLCSSGMRIGGLANLKVGSLEKINDLFKITVYEGEAEEYKTFCSSEARRAVENYFDIRRRHCEEITGKSPVIREQYDRKDHLAVTHPKHVKEPALARKLVDLTEAAGIRTRVKLTEGQKAASIRQNVPCCNGMRRFFTTQLLKSELQSELRWKLEGHALKANDNSYVRVSIEDLLAQYMKAHDNLLISQEHQLRNKVEKLEIEKTQLDRLAARMKRLEDQIKR